MDYTEYSVEDLASDESFIEWARDGNAPSRAFWEDFVRRHPHMTLKVQQARTLVLNLGKAERRRISDHQVDAIWSAIDSRIRKPLMLEASLRRKRRSFQLAVAAVVSAVVAFGVWTLTYRSESVQILSGEEHLTSAEYLEEVNTSGAVRRIHLSDGSTVALENNGRLRYRRNFDEEDARVVHLTGEAFFEVTKDPRRPFLVHTDQIVTRVLGTSFRVKAPEGDENIVISVKTGKVSVYALSNQKSEEDVQKNAVILMPNQQLTYQRTHDTFGKGIVETPEVVSSAITEEEFNFQDRPVREVFSILEKAYGIEIIFDEEVMSRCYVTAPLGSEPLFQKLQVICRAIGARYEVIDARVVITSAGC